MLVIARIRFYGVMWKHISFLDAKPIIKYYDDQVVELVIIIVPDDIQFSALDGCVTAFPPAFNLIKQNNQTTTSNFPCNFNFAVSNMNRFNQGIYHG